MEDYFLTRKNLIPSEKNLEYFHYPWTWRSVVIDELKPESNKELFTICCFFGLYSSAYIEIFKRMNIKKVYSPHVEIGKEYVHGIEFIPFQHIIPDEVTPKITEKKYKISFVGTLETHPIRLLLYNIFKNNKDFKFIIRDDFHMDVRNQSENVNEVIEYQTIMKQSEYTLCPLGMGVGSIRFWEALKYNSTPIVISDKVLLNVDPSRYIRIPESDLLQLNSIINHN